MNKRWYILIVLVLLVSCLFTGCGVSKSQYDAVAAELETVKQERQAAQDQLQTTQAELSEVKLDLQTAQADLAKAQQQLDARDEQLQEAQTDLQTTEGQLKMTQINLQAIQTQLDTTRSELTQTKIDLQASTAQAKLLQKDLDALNEKRAEALKYAELIDILMFEIWMGQGLTPRFDFNYANSLNDWKAAAYDKATATGDAELLDMLIDLFNSSSGDAARDVLYRIWYDSLGVMENDLK
jgi:septal ring factor EnvC (AmiA/AmiB activator)